MRAVTVGWLTISLAQVRQPRHAGLLSVSTVCSSPMKLLPLPYLTGSTCVCGSG